MKNFLRVPLVLFFLALIVPSNVDAAFGTPTGRAQAADEVSDTTIAANPSANLAPGVIVIVTAVTDNVATADGATTLHSISDTDSNTWIKAYEETETDGAAGDGTTTSVWWTKVVTQIDTTDAITLTTSSAVGAKMINAVSVTVGAGNTLASTTDYSLVSHFTSGNPSQALVDLTSREYLFFGLTGAESADTLSTCTGYTELYDDRTANNAPSSQANHICYLVSTTTGSTFTTSSFVFTNALASLTAFYEIADPTAALSGTITSSATEGDVVAGGKTIILTLTNATWVAAGTLFNDQRQNIINGLDSAQSEAGGWDAVVKATQGVSGVVRTSDTVVTITLDAFAGYSVTADETITATIPYTALTKAMGMVAAPTFTITNTILVSGHIYSAEPSTAFNCSTNNLTISISIGGAAPTTTTCTNTNGDWSKGLVIVSGNIMNVWVSGQATGTVYAETVYITNGSDKTDINLWQNTLAVRHDTGSSITRANLSTGLYSTKGQQLYSFSGANLTIDSAIELHVWGGMTFDASGGTLTTQGIDTGDVHIDTSAVMTIGTGTSVIAGDVDVDGTLNLGASVNFGGATFVSAGTTAATAGTHTFTSTTAVSGGGTINFYDLVTSGTGTLTLSSAVSTDNNVSVGTGTTLQNNATLTVGGDADVTGKLTIAAALNINGGALTTVGSGVGGVSINYANTPTTTIATAGTLGGGSGSINVYNLTFTGSGTATLSTNNIVINNALSLQDTHVFAMGTNSLTIGSTTISDSGDITIATGASTTHTSGTVTILGNSGNAADWSGPGEFDAANLVIGDDLTTFTVDNVTGDLPLDIAGNFTLNNAATFQAASTTTKFQVGGNWLVDATSAVFTAGDGTVTLDSTDAANITSGGDPFYHLTINDGGQVTPVIFELQDALDVNGNLTITSGDVDVKNTVNNAINLAGNWTNAETAGNGGFIARSATVYLDGAADSTQTIDGNTTFYNLTATTGDRIIVFDDADTFTIAASGTFTATGGSCSTLIAIRSDLKGNPFDITKTGSINFDFVDIQDMTVSAAGGAVNESVDSGGNSNLDFTVDNHCISGSTDADEIASGYSFQRKTFYDDANLRYWTLNHDGDEIEVKYSTDSAHWAVPNTAASGHLGYDTNDFSVWWQQIGTTEYVWMAVADSNDIKIRQGALTVVGGVTDVTWDTDVATILNDADGRCSAYKYPYISLDKPASGNPHIWVTARCTDGANYAIEARATTTTAEADPSTWTYADAAQLSDDQANANVFANIVPLGSEDMYATFVVDTAIEGCVWDDSDAAWENSAGTATCSVVSGGGESEGSATRGTGGVKIDDAGDPGSGTFSGRHTLQLSNGTLYSFINDGGNVEAWSSSNGSSWTQQDSGTTVTSADAQDPVVAVDSSDNVHVAYKSSNNLSIFYRKFTTSGTPAWGSEDTVRTFSNGIDALDLDVDANDIPHIVSKETTTLLIEYNNKVGGSWKSGANAPDVESVAHTNLDIIINEDNIPEIFYNNTTDADLTAAEGNQNDATSFTLWDVDTVINNTVFQRGLSAGIDADGNTWVAYTDDTNNYIALAKHTDGTTWNSDANWTVVSEDATLDNDNVGYEPSLSIIGKTIIVFYENDAASFHDIAYDIYDSGTQKWANASGQEFIGADATGAPDYDSPFVRYSKYNFHEPWLMDFLYSNGTDVYWSYVDLRATKIDDASDFQALPGGGRQVVRTRSGDLYSFVNDAGSCEMWKSSDGYTWEKQSTDLTCDSGTSISAAIDGQSNQDIHVAYIVSPGVKYRAFDTTTEAWEGVEETIYGFDSSSYLVAMTVDAGNIPHAVATGLSSPVYSIVYNNRVGGSWDVTATNVESKAAASVDIVIDDEAGGGNGIPEIVYINTADGQLTAALGSDNDPIGDGTPFTLQDVDTAINNTDNQRGASIAVNTLTGDTWISYIDGTNNYVALAKHADAAAWTSWTIVDSDATLDNNNVGYEPSIAIAGASKIYVFYEEDDSDTYHDVAYDVYDSVAQSWSGETILQEATGSPDYQDVKAKGSFEWNNYGANRIDYLFSNGTDVYWDYLYVRRSPTNIDNASDFGELPDAGKQLLRSSSGVLYAAINDGGNCEIWKSADGGVSWAIQDTNDDPACSTSTPYVVAIDSTDTLHMIYQDDVTAANLNYITFDTRTEQFGTESPAIASFNLGGAVFNITIDSNDKAHVVAYSQATNPGVFYSNNVSGSWKSQVVIYEVATMSIFSLNIVISEDNTAEVSYIDSYNSDLRAAVGNQNDATTFTDKNVDFTINNTLNRRGTSIGIDSSGNTWIAYLDEDGTDDYITLAKHADGTDWSDDANWTIDTEDTSFSSGMIGLEPSMVIDGTNIYVFYEDDQDNIVFNKYNGTSWSGETLLEEHGALQDAKVRWSYINNYDSTGKAAVQTNTYYFDASDAAASDPQSVWTNDTSAFDGSTGTTATAGVTGSTSTNYLMAEGTNAPASGGTITSVRARIYGNAGPDASVISAAIYTNGLGALLETPINNNGSASWDDFTTLPAPAGGWTWPVLQSLETKVYITDNGVNPSVARVEILVQSTNSSQNEFDYIYSDGTDVFYNRYTLNTTPGTQDAIATTTSNADPIYNLSAVSDGASPNDVHLVYLDNSATKKVKYKRWDNNGASSAWTTDVNAVTVDETVSSTNLYVNLSLDATSKDLVASWVDQTSDDHVYYKTCDVTTTSDECSTAAKWGTRTSESTATGDVYNSLTANYSGASKVFVIWTNTATTPFAVLWSSIVAAAGNNAPSAPTTLYVNERVTTAQSGVANPVSVGDATPVFSAIYNDADSGDIANKYEVIVYSDGSCTTQVWDSGSNGTSMTNCTQGNRCGDITFGGTALPLDGTTYYWKIKYWDDEPVAGSFSSCTTDTFTMVTPNSQLRHGGHFFNNTTESPYSW